MVLLLCESFFVIIIYYPLYASPTAPQPTTGRASQKKKKRVFFISSRSTVRLDLFTVAGRITNQSKPPVFPNSPSPGASVNTLFCGPHVRLRGSISPVAAIGGGKWVKSGVLVALGNIPCPDCSSGACRSPTMMYCFTGSNFSLFLHCIFA